MARYSIKVDIEVPGHEAAFDALCRMMYGIDPNETEGVEHIDVKAAVVLPGTVVDEIELERDRQFGDELSAIATAGMNHNPLPADFPTLED